jgi:hypothetical protein
MQEIAMHFCLVADGSHAKIGGEIGIVSCADAYALAMFDARSARKMVRVPVVAPAKNEPRYATPGMFGVVVKLTPITGAGPAATRVDFLCG